MAPTVLRLIDIVSGGHRRGVDEVASVIKANESLWLRGMLALALRHVSIEDGGECIDQTHRRRGRVLSGSLAERVARRLHLRPELVHALMNLVLLPVHGGVWPLLQNGAIDPVRLWRSLIREPEFARIMRQWALAGPDARPPRAFVYVFLNGGDLSEGWAAHGGAYWQDEAPPGVRWAANWN